MSPHIIDPEKRAFQLLPVEVNENIASFLDTEKDFANFNAICRESHDTVQSHRCGAWRAQWKQEYDLPLGMTGLQIKAEYQRRRMVLHTNSFDKGKTVAEKNCIATLKQLIIESFTGSSKKVSNNMLRLERFFQQSNILSALNSCIIGPAEHCTLELQALLACSAHWYLDSLPLKPHVSYSLFPRSKILVYSELTAFPMFLDSRELIAARVNMRTVLHTINFWRYHINVRLCNILHGLEGMNGWTRPISEGHEGLKGLPRQWKGVYAYMPDMERFREQLHELPSWDVKSTIYLEELEEEFGQEHIEFDFEAAHNTAAWPKAFEDHLQALPSVSLRSHRRDLSRTEKEEGEQAAKQRDKANEPTNGHRHSSKRNGLRNISATSYNPANEFQVPCASRKPVSGKFRKIISPLEGTDYLSFSGSIESDDTSSDYQGLSGILHNLPEQAGIPGFQRISFMKYEVTPPAQERDTDDVMEPRGFPKDKYSLVDESCWCYQGVVLPGSHIILGRWWSPLGDEEQFCTGPFLLWAVED